VTIQADNKTIKRLEEWKCREHREPSYIELYQKLLGLGVEDSYSPILDAHVHEIANRFEQDNSVLQFEDLLLDWAALEKLFQQASSIVTEYPSLTTTAASALKKVSTQPRLMEKAARAWYQYSLPPDIADKIGVDRETLSLSFQATFHPVLIRYSEVLSPLVNQDSWRQKLCPICGGKPDFAFLSSETGARWLVCSRCDTEWLFFRLQCPFCGNQDQDSLAYFTNDNELYRLYVCEQCRKYIKAIDLRRAEGDILFPLERVFTLDMDRQGHEAGYEPGWITIGPSGEGFKN
jgi:hypothetical protein